MRSAARDALENGAIWSQRWATWPEPWSVWPKLLSLIRGLTRNLKSGEGDLHIEHFSCVRPAFLHFRAY